MATKTLTYDDFSKGEFGRIKAWNAPKGSWTGMNMLVYRTGEIGVRPGVRNVSPTGLANGVVWGLGIRPDSSGQVWFGQGTAVRYFNPVASPVGALTTLTGALSGTPSVGQIDHFAAGALTYLVTGAAGAYSLSLTNVTALTGSPSGFAIALVDGPKLVIGSPSANTLTYSGLADFNTWPGSISVGGSGTMSFGKQRTHLAIFKQGDGAYVLTGVPGVNETLRQVTRYPFVPGGGAPGAVCVSRDSDLVWMYPGGGLTGSSFPIMFDGARLREYKDVPAPSPGVDSRLIDIPWLSDGGMVFLGEQTTPPVLVNPTLVFHRGAFTRHTFDSSMKIRAEAGAAMVVGPYTPDPTASLDHNDDIEMGSAVIMTDGGAAGAHPVFWSWPLDLDRPGSETAVASTVQERAGDNSSTAVTGNFSMPEHWETDGSELQVRGVIVDFRSWNTAGASTNHFEVTVDALRTFDASTAPRSSSTLTWDQAVASSSRLGTMQRQHFSFGDQGQGGGFQVHFTACRGVAIRRVQVIYEAAPARGY